MKKIFFILSMVYLSVSAYCQSNNTLELKVKDFEKYLVDFDSFRIVLLDQGFKMNRNDSTENGISEFWGISESRTAPSGRVYDDEIVGVQISTWYCNGIAREKFISLGFLNDRYQELVNQFKSDVKKSFPIKRLVPIWISSDGGEKKDSYILKYSKVDSKIEVEIKEETLGSQHMTTFYFSQDLR